MVITHKCYMWYIYSINGYEISCMRELVNSNIESNDPWWYLSDIIDITYYKMYYNINLLEISNVNDYLCITNKI